MTPYHIKIAPTVIRQIRSFSIKQQKLVVKLIEALGVNPRPTGANRIEGLAGLYRESEGSIHLIYKVEEHEVLILSIRTQGHAKHGHSSSQIE